METEQEIGDIEIHVEGATSERAPKTRARPLEDLAVSGPILVGADRSVLDIVGRVAVRVEAGVGELCAREDCGELGDKEYGRFHQVQILQGERTQCPKPLAHVRDQDEFVIQDKPTGYVFPQ